MAAAAPTAKTVAWVITAAPAVDDEVVEATMTIVSIALNDKFSMKDEHLLTPAPVALLPPPFVVVAYTHSPCSTASPIHVNLGLTSVVIALLITALLITALGVTNAAPPWVLN